MTNSKNKIASETDRVSKKEDTEKAKETKIKKKTN